MKWKWRYIKQNLFMGAVSLCALLIILALGGILFYIFQQRLQAINWEFLTSPPRDSMTRGGIMPAILGTLYLTLGRLRWPCRWGSPRRFI
jgi:phosphate transport system permease protein